MTQARSDMSDWVIHFVHKRDPDNDAFIYDDQGDGHAIPLHADADKHSRFDLWQIKAEERPLEHDAGAFAVLLRILDDGHIRTGWSMRGGRPTIYGPRPACCFTEMPLYALLQYAQTRSNASAVDVYGIAVLKAELFAAGGRAVIYGLSNEHREQSGSNLWPRMLDSSCGIAATEQYRYVSMKLGGEHSIDWSHEREWRWADVGDRCECPGLPIWSDDDNIRFSSVVVIVRKLDEAERVLNSLKCMMDAGCDEYTFQYNRTTVQRTRVLVLDEALAQAKRAVAPLRLDDLPLRELRIVAPVEPDAAMIERVRAATKRAKDAAEKAASEWPRSLDVFGFAYLMVDDPRSATVQAMLKLGEVEATGGIGYRLRNVGCCYDSGLLGQAECAVQAAKNVLESELPEATFYTRTVWD